jgi:very-short-patch-repair endonuclease
MKYIGSKEHLKNARKAGLLGLKKILENKKDRINEYNINPNRCIFCNKVLEYEKKHKKFCNSSCAAKHNNKKRKLSSKTKLLIGSKLKGRKQTEEHKNKVRGNKNGRWKNGMYAKEYTIEQTCVICGRIFIPQISLNGKLSKSKCCSDECHFKLKSNNSKAIINERIANGTHNGWSARNIVSYPEQFFMEVLTNNNIKFKHNYPVDKRSLGLTDACNYFLDFFIENKNIDLEIDGKQHKARKKHDDFRDSVLIKNGYVVYRIKWKNINTENGKEYVKNEINRFLEFYNN